MTIIVATTISFAFRYLIDHVSVMKAVLEKKWNVGVARMKGRDFVVAPNLRQDWKAPGSRPLGHKR